jgi:hypothetical protein
MPLIKKKTTKIGDQTIYGEIRFTKWIESGGKLIHENVYVVDINIPRKSINGKFSYCMSLLHKIFESKDEAKSFFDLEYKKIIKQKREAK